MEAAYAASILGTLIVEDKSMFCNPVRLSAVLLFTLVGSPVAALTPAIRFDPDDLVTGSTIEPDGLPYASSDSQNTAGWGFSLSEPATLTHLGMFDWGADGLNEAYYVGLWGAEGLVASQLVPSGEQADLEGTWRYVSVDEPVNLAAGGYALGALLVPEPIVAAGQSVVAGYLEDPSSYDWLLAGHQPQSEVFYWNFDVFSDADCTLIPNDERVYVCLSAPAYTSAPGFGPPDSGLLVQGAFVGPTVFLTPVPEPASGVIAGALLICAAFSTNARR